MTETVSNSWARVEQRREASRGPFEKLCINFLGLDRYGRTNGRELPVFGRLRDALAALDEFRRAHNQDGLHAYEEVELSVRVVADELANQIQHATGPEHDPATIAWVLAGMRCPSQPFCTGCRSCFTITSPNRPIAGEVGAQ